jgi:hypothetical protein
MTRLFLSSYPTSGTHQAVQMIMHEVPEIVDRSGMPQFGLTDWGMADIYPLDRMENTIKKLSSFSGKAFGHLAYIPEFAVALRSQPTKFLFNVRDPRDIIVGEYEKMLGMRRKNPQHPIITHWGNYQTPGRDGVRLMEGPDPIGDLIQVAGLRWKNWIGWLDEDFTYLLHYEDLRLRTLETCNHVKAAFADCPLPPAATMASQANDTGWSTSFRKGLVGEHKNYFTPEHFALAEEHLGWVMERLGYDLEGRIG